jgi:DNA-binding beta-propeller fold protein YncE
MLLKARNPVDLPHSRGGDAQVAAGTADPFDMRGEREHPMEGQVRYSASVAARRVMASLGRTEDVKFSPSNRRLAVAGFHANKVAVFDADVRCAAHRIEIALTGAVEIEAATFCGPHGLCFLDEDTLAVANREGAVEVFGLPGADAAPSGAPVATRTIRGGAVCPTHTPGSVAAVRVDDDTTELLVCNNYANSVTRHLLDRRRDFAVRSDELLLAHRLDVPDGIAVSGDGRWLAISNHNTHSILLYDRSRGLHPGSAPDGVLRNVLCPHGLVFTPDQAFILVADAGARYVNVYRKGEKTWHGTRDPVRLFPAVSEEVFRRGRLNPQEGGPKGIDLSSDGRLLVATCDLQALAFFDASEILDVVKAPGNRLRRYLQWRVSNALFKRLGFMLRLPA